MTTEYFIDIDLLDQVIAVCKKAHTDFNIDKSDYQKDLVLAKQGIEILLNEYAKQYMKKLAEKKEDCN